MTLKNNIKRSLLLFAVACSLGANSAQAQPNSSERYPGSQAAVQADEFDELEPEFEYQHGFRMGYGFINGVNKENSPLTTPSLYVLGYELSQRLVGGESIDVIFVEMAAISGMNQGLLIPTANFLIGMEVNRTFRMASGVHISPFETTGDITHMIAAIGYSIDAGRFTIPLDVAWIPDTDPSPENGGNNWRAFTTVGVNW